jgi:hypothetical protein
MLKIDRGNMMGLKIIKLAAFAQTKVATVPKITRFFYEIPHQLEELTTFKIDTTNFLSDTGTLSTELPNLNENNGYFNVYINGILQMEDNFAYTSGEEGIGNLLISVPEGSDITANSPIILEVINFYPTTETVIHS